MGEQPHIGGLSSLALKYEKELTRGKQGRGTLRRKGRISRGLEVKTCHRSTSRGREKMFIK